VVIRDEAGARDRPRPDPLRAEHARAICGLKSDAIEPAHRLHLRPMVHADDLALAAHGREA
jgi:glutamate 5-kinase